MSNILLNPDMIAAESLDQFENELAFAKAVTREWEDRFGRDGAKIGDSLRLRKPVNFEVQTGNAFSAQNIEEQYDTLTIDTPLHVDVVTTNAELALNIDRFSERYAKPAMRRLANKVDALLGALYKKVPATAGTYNTVPSALSNFTDARAKLNAFGVPEDDRFFVLDPITEGASIAFLSALFNPQKQIGEQYIKGSMGRALGARFLMGQNVAAHTVGALGGTPLANAASPQTGSSIICDGASNSITGLLKQGDIVTFSGVNAVNALTGDDLGFLREFVVTADVDSDGSGNFTIPVYPPVTITGPYKTCSAGVANNATVLIFGHASDKAGLVARQPLYFHKSWATLVIAPQTKPNGVHQAAMKSDPDGGGIGIRYVCDFDIDNNLYKHRWDISVGMLAQRPDFALRLMTS